MPGGVHHLNGRSSNLEDLAVVGNMGLEFWVGIGAKDNGSSGGLRQCNVPGDKVCVKVGLKNVLNA